MGTCQHPSNYADPSDDPWPIDQFGYMTGRVSVTFTFFFFFFFVVVVVMVEQLKTSADNAE